MVLHNASKERDIEIARLQVELKKAGEEREAFQEECAKMIQVTKQINIHTPSGSLDNLCT